MILRRYQQTDHAAVMDLHVRVLRPTGGFIEDLNGLKVLDKDLEDIEKTYFENGGYFLIGEENGQVMAMGALKKVDSQTAEIKRMRVVPEFQRAGIGSQILSALEEKARAFGYRELVLDTGAIQIPAQNFYKRHGYVVTHIEKVCGMDCVFFKKALSPKI